jgi:hypothetical protein
MRNIFSRRSQEANRLVLVEVTIKIGAAGINEPMKLIHAIQYVEIRVKPH